MKTVTVSPILENVEYVTQFVRNELKAHGCSLKNQFKIAIAIDELFSNIVKHSIDADSNDVILSVYFEDDPKAVLISIVDSGKPFNMLERRDPNIRLSAKERKPGGLGIFMVKRIMDDIKYEYKNGNNILHIIKYL